MDYLWSPWRYQYVTQQAPSEGCVFCAKIQDKPQQENDEENFVLHRGRNNFVILNLFPYTSGHLMVVPYSHIGQLSAADDATWAEMMALTRKAEQALQQHLERPWQAVDAAHPGPLERVQPVDPVLRLAGAKSVAAVEAVERGSGHCESPASGRGMGPLSW